MARSHYTTLLCAAAAVAATSACASSSAASAQQLPAPLPASAPELRKVATDSAGMARARADSMRLPYTAADIRFMSGMVGHHAQAIAMSRMAQPRGASPAVQRLAERIINAQIDEIVIMQQWLVDRGQPIPEARIDPRDAMHMEHSGHMMPGMLTMQQMQELEAARGKEFDRLFLKYMIQHHSGAVLMVKELFATPGAGQDEIVFRFATDVNVDQSTEIARMNQMLAAMQP